jgi:hypothetical protein
MSISVAPSMLAAPQARMISGPFRSSPGARAASVVPRAAFKDSMGAGVASVAAGFVLLVCSSPLFGTASTGHGTSFSI